MAWPRPCVDERARVGMFVRSPSGSCGVVEAVGRLSRRRRFAGQRRFVDGEVDGLDTRASAGTRSPVRSSTTSPGTTSRAGTTTLCAVAQHVRGRRGHLPQRFERAVGAVLLDEPEQHGEQHDDGDDDGLEGVTEEAREDRAAPSRIRIRTFLNWAANVCQADGARGRLQLVGPVAVRGAAAASAPVNPWRGAEAQHHIATDSVCQSTDAVAAGEAAAGARGGGDAAPAPRRDRRVHRTMRGWSTKSIECSDQRR